MLLFVVDIFVFATSGVSTTHTSQTDKHELVDSELAVSQEYKYFIGYLKFPSECCKRDGKMRLPSIFVVSIKNMVITKESNNGIKILKNLEIDRKRNSYLAASAIKRRSSK